MTKAKENIFSGFYQTSDSNCCCHFACSVESCNRLLPALHLALAAVAQKYYAASGEVIVITSGWRSLWRCAELMSACSAGQLESMYCRRGYPDYIRQILQARQAAGGTLSLSSLYHLLQTRREGYISWHLQGAAVDISSRLRQPELLCQLLERHNFSWLNEESLGIACIHASLKGLQAAFVTE